MNTRKRGTNYKSYQGKNQEDKAAERQQIFFLYGRSRTRMVKREVLYSPVLSVPYLTIPVNTVHGLTGLKEVSPMLAASNFGPKATGLTCLTLGQEG
jgi:hypothetical protein